MTGFGRAEKTHGAYHAQVEASSVNRKQSEVVIHAPRSLAQAEPELRKKVLAKVARGRVMLQIKVDHAEGATPEISLDEGRLTAVQEVLRKLEAKLGKEIDADLASLLRIPNLLNFEAEVPPEAALEVVLPAVEEALLALVAMRTKEGADLSTDILKRLTFLEKMTQEIETYAPDILKRHHQQLRDRLEAAGLPLPLDDERLVKEIAVHSDRCDITEETTRLHSHFTKFRDYAASPEPMGRSLDFLCQEINRELNTIGSKANDATLAHHVVTAKTELEKIREQVQNVE